MLFILLDTCVEKNLQTDLDVQSTIGFVWQKTIGPFYAISGRDRSFIGSIPNSAYTVEHQAIIRKRIENTNPPAVAIITIHD